MAPAPPCRHTDRPSTPIQTAHELVRRPAEVAQDRPQRPAAAGLAQGALDRIGRGRGGRAGCGRCVVRAGPRQGGRSASGRRGRDRQRWRGKRVGAGCDRLCGRAADGHGLRQDHRQGARGADRGRPACRGRRRDGAAGSDRCRCAARSFRLAAGRRAEPDRRQPGAIEGSRGQCRAARCAGRPEAGLARAVRTGRGAT